MATIAPAALNLSTNRHLTSARLTFRPTNTFRFATHITPYRSNQLRLIYEPRWPTKPAIVTLSGGCGGTGDGRSGRGGGGGGGEGGEEEEESARDKNRNEAFLALAEIGRPLESLPSDLAEAIEAGRVPGAIVHRFAELEKSAVFRWLLRFGGFKERLLADDLFLAKVGMECGFGTFTKVWVSLKCGKGRKKGIFGSSLYLAF